jgi:hypothetical protein
MEREREDRRERYARNEALFREVNERIKQLAEQWTATDELIEFTCECANRDCAERVRASLDDYEFVRVEPTRFLVAPGHLDLEVEDVIAERETFWIVDKRGDAAEAATELDPRS